MWWFLAIIFGVIDSGLCIWANVYVRSFNRMYLNDVGFCAHTHTPCPLYTNQTIIIYDRQLGIPFSLFPAPPSATTFFACVYIDHDLIPHLIAPPPPPLPGIYYLLG